MSVCSRHAPSLPCHPSLPSPPQLPVLCCDPPDRRTWELLKSMADCTPIAVEVLLKQQMDKALPG